MFAAVLHASVTATGDSSYAAAYQETLATGKPIVVMVSTDWCAPCQTMKRQVLPEVRKRGVLEKVAFAVVNPDHEQQLGRQLLGGGPIPQLIMYRSTPQGWMRRKLIGGQSVSQVEQFINRGLALDAATKRAAAKTRVTETSAGQRLAKNTAEDR
jgi:thioredoxin-like negative regulator of GroEL